MQKLIRRAMTWAYTGETFVARWRRQRMHAMLKLLQLPSGARVVDLGGDENLWKLVDHDFHITLVNLREVPVSDSKRFTAVQADACDLHNVFDDVSFDLAFSNSVIEHVGDDQRQECFAGEIRRLAQAYWVQTPGNRFPVEPHTGVPFYFRLPRGLRNALIRRWQRECIAGFGEVVQACRVLSRRRMMELFPDGQVYVEHKLGFEKSYAMYRSYNAR